MIAHGEIARRIEDEGGAGTPEKAMLEQRVAVLESSVGKIHGILERLEPKISEILLTGAKQADLHKTQLDVAEMKGRMSALEGKFTGVEGRFTGLEGRINGLDARIGLLPSTWTILSIVFATWALGSGILIFSLTRILSK